MSVNAAYEFFAELRLKTASLAWVRVVAPGHPVAYVEKRPFEPATFYCRRGKDFIAGTFQASTA